MYEVYSAHQPIEFESNTELEPIDDASSVGSGGEHRTPARKKIGPRYNKLHESEVSLTGRNRADSDRPIPVSTATGHASQASLTPGSMVWVQMQDHSLAAAIGVADWKRATISSRYGETLTLILDYGDRNQRMIGAGKVSQYRVVNAATCFPANPTVQADLTSLAHIHEPAILYNVQQRALWGFPYTFIGEVLISINPLRNIGDTGLDFLRDPHPRTVAERSLRRLRFGIKEKNRREIEELKNTKKISVTSNLSKGKSGMSAVKSAFSTLTKTLRNSTVRKKELKPKEEEVKEKKEDELKVNQAVIISGESGSGKTEAARRVLSQLVDGFDVDEEDDSLQDRILASEPLLESFGNARTSKNPNSSRFGKFLKIYYTIDEEDFVELRAAGISTYLLEISRVVRQSPKERNFRIFYNVLATPLTKLRESLGLNAASNCFAYINGNYKKERQDEAQYFELHEAFKNSKLGISWPQLLEVVAALLHLGNVVFGTKTTTEGDIAEIKPQIVNDIEYDALAWTAHCFGIEEDPLKSIILEKVVRVGREEVVTIRNPALAKQVADSIAKKVYTLAFEWMIVKMNGSLIESDYSAKQLPFTNYVGILDVFGFEVFDSNGLEQLLINYANEVLQLVFTEQVLVAEAELFRREGIVLDASIMPPSSVAGKPGQARLAFFDKVFKTLDNTMRLPKANDARFAKELQKQVKNDPLYITPHRKDFGRKFVIKHFASKVEYTVGEFLMKNNDNLPDLSSLFTLSTNPLLQQLQIGERPRGSFKNELQRERSMGLSSQGSSRKRGGGRRRRKKSIFRASGNFPSEASTSNKKKSNLWGSNKKLVVGSKKKTTVSSVFKKQIKELSASLKSCGCSYIRCVKPNPLMTPPGGDSRLYDGENVSELYSFYGLAKAEMVLKARTFYKSGSHIKKRIGNQIGHIQKSKKYFDANYVTRQLHFLGVFDAVKVLKSGLPTRINYTTFMSTFQNSIPIDSSAYLKNLPPNGILKSRSYIAALLYAFRVPGNSYRLGLTKVFFKFGQIDNISVILSCTSNWSNEEEVGNEFDVFDESDENKMSKGVVTRRFYNRLMRMRWRSAYVKIRVYLIFLSMMQRNTAARLIQRTVRSFLERKESMYRLMLDKRALELQRVWRGYLARKIAKELRDERERLRQMEQRKQEAIRLKYIEKKNKQTMEAFAEVQSRHRRKLNMEKIRLKRQQERIFASMEAIRAQKRAEAEQKKKEEEAAKALAEKLRQERQLQAMRRKRHVEKTEGMKVLRQKLQETKANVKNIQKREAALQKDKAFQKATLRKRTKEKLDIISGVAELQRIEKKIEKIEQVEAVLVEVVGEEEPVQDSLPRKEKKSSVFKKRQWLTRREGTFHKSTFATRMNIIRTENKPVLVVEDESDTNSDHNSIVEGEIQIEPKVKEPEDEEPLIEVSPPVESEEHHYGLSKISKGIFKTRYALLAEKAKEVSHIEHPEGFKSGMEDTFLKAFMKDDKKKRMLNPAHIKYKEELAAEIENFAKILEIELSIDDIQPVERKLTRHWKDRVKGGVRYRNIKRKPRPKKKQMDDPNVLKELSTFLVLQTKQFSTKVFRCNNGNPRSSFVNLNNNPDLVAAGAGVEMKKRKVTLQRFAISAGQLQVFESGGRKKQILNLKLDHKVKFTPDEDGTKQPKFRLFALHVPSGKCVCFEFNGKESRDEWHTMLKKSEYGFFGNNLLDSLTRVKLSQIDSTVRRKGDYSGAIAALAKQKGKNNSTANPRFKKGRSVKALISAHENKGSSVSNWTNTYLNIGKKPQSTRMPNTVNRSKSGRHKDKD